MRVWRVESLSVQSNVSHSSSIKVKDSGDSAEQRSAHHVHRHRRVRVRRTSPDTFRQRQTAPAPELQSKVLENFTIMEKRPLLILNVKVLVGAFNRDCEIFAKVRLKLYKAPRTVSRVTET